MRTRRGLSTIAALCGAAALAAGCGEDSGGPADQYAGVWRYDDAQSVVQCLDADPLSQPPLANKTWARGIGAEIVDLSVIPLEKSRGVTCDFAFDVTGPKARIRPDQTCQLNSIDVLTIDPDPAAEGKPAWTFTLNAATKAEEIVTSTIHIFQPSTTPGAPPVETTCAWSMIAHLTRISKD
jgi:hypothetical protein